MADTVGFLAHFEDPPKQYRPIPFWWWNGDRLDLGRLEWELDQLRAQRIYCAIISYSHRANGDLDPGEPAVFSDAWWDLLRSLLLACEDRGMSLGFQDYCLLKPVLTHLVDKHPELAGRELRHRTAVATPGVAAVIELPAGARVLEAVAYPTDGGQLQDSECVFLETGENPHGHIQWSPSSGCWTVIASFTQPGIYNPLHADSGARVLEAFFGEFERRLPGALGRTLTVSFQDELDFGCRFPLWSDDLYAEFAAVKGYPLKGRLAKLFVDLDAESAKVRLDFHSVANALAQRHWFEPLYRWHEARGLLFGHDNMGRGGVAVGAAAYGDTMGAMRWYSAPGSDDPNLNGPRAFKGIKVASSIAHLYGRPRVWAECFHSSGWGIAPGTVRDALNELFALGATLINLHGLYYSTHGGWWEWAPPDFHFRQPYWAHMEHLHSYAARLSWLLSQGEPVCDVAILYPGEAVAAGLNAPAAADLWVARSLSEAQRNEGAYAEDLAEALSFAAAQALFAAAVDFDFIDSDSLAGSSAGQGVLHVGRNRYRLVVLAEATAVPWAVLDKLLSFSRAGGRIIVLGRPPLASDRAGRDDALLDALVAELLSRAIHLDAPTANFSEFLIAASRGRARVSGGQANLLRRRLPMGDLIVLRNSSALAAQLQVELPAETRGLMRLHPEDGTTQEYPIDFESPDAPRFEVSLAGKALAVFLSGAARDAAPAVPEMTWRMLRELPTSRWEFTLAPTLDNRYGDFELPPSAGVLGPRTGTMWSAVATDSIHDRPEAVEQLDWVEFTPGVAPLLRLLGPFPADCDIAELDSRVLGGAPLGTRSVTHRGIEYPWRDYCFSVRSGIDRDPFLKRWDSGPHGLKGRVPDEFIDLCAETPGEVFYLAGTLAAPALVDIDLVASSRAAHAVWLDENLLLEQPQELAPGLQSIWNLPLYDAVPRSTRVSIGPEGRRLVMRLIQPRGQRIRAYVAPAAPAAPPTDSPRLRWFHAPDRAAYRPVRRAMDGAVWLKCIAPPGLRALHLVHGGDARAWIGGIEAEREVTSTRHSGGSRFSIAAAAAESSTVLIRLAARERQSAPELVDRPMTFECDAGVIDLGDWSRFGLEAYSGMATYRKDFILSPSEAGQPLAIALGEVAGTCDVRLNGIAIGTLLGAPWRLPLRDTARAGTNTLEVRVANTLANFYACYRPTPYASRDDLRSGLIGPVSILAGAVPRP
ncbi:MAG: hypothetical protein M3O41_02810 [Pseudomonadota bacterium]|nr:hypothetical protein [Pseudomonadota bacterium]